jgi:hypothetical protein
MEITRELLNSMTLPELKKTFDVELRGLKKLKKREIVEHLLERTSLHVDGNILVNHIRYKLGPIRTI